MSWRNAFLALLSAMVGGVMVALFDPTLIGLGVTIGLICCALGAAMEKSS